MRSILEDADTTNAHLIALAEIQHCLSQIIACKTSDRLTLDETGRDGLASLFYLLAKETEKTPGMLEGSHE